MIVNNSKSILIIWIELPRQVPKGRIPVLSRIANTAKTTAISRLSYEVENNAFNTLKNEGYHFNHNFGRSYNNLCSVFGMLLMLAFFIDQVQELSCSLWKAARAKFNSLTSLWDAMRRKFNEYLINSWDDLYNAIAYGRRNPITLVLNAS